MSDTVFRPAASVVAMGPWATVCFEDLLSLGLADPAILEECERTAVDLTAALGAGSDLAGVPGLVFRNGAEVRVTERRAPLADLDDLPLADRRVLPVWRYYGMLNRRRRYTALWTSRGCSRACGHCAVPAAWGPWRGRSPAHVVEEIRRLVMEHGTNEFHFEDDDFLADRDRALQIARQIKEARLDVIWQAANGVRADELDEDMLAAFADSGCYRIEIGLETLNPEVAGAIGRPFDPDRLARAVRAARRLRIEPGGYFILGLPGESLESMRNTVRRARDLDLVLASFSLYRPIPGSPLYEAEGGRVAGADRPEVRELAAWAARKFYFRPRTVPLALRYIRCLPRACKALARYRRLARSERT